MSQQSAYVRSIVQPSSSTSGAPAGSAADVEFTDLELVERIRRKDQAAFNLLYDRYFQRIYGFVQVRLRNRADSEEVVQEVFTAVFSGIGTFRGTSAVLGWIYGIAKNSVNNHIRRASAQALRIERAEFELSRSSFSLDAYTPEERLTLSRCEDVLRERLDSLPDWHAEVFVMRHLENLPIPKIAERVSRSSDAVRSSLYRAKKMVMESIDPGLAAAS
ncbi:MAG: sigma-70 family RNA polymerase sigma factor [Myxococcales bacterium]|nr:sigma-70 family RNA polymerase sigma factor [Myxococcales bacterium]